MIQPYPFSAISGQSEMKDALILAAIDPSIGGVLVFGDRGTGKSTAVRALAALLPPIPVRKDCRYNCDPARPAVDCPDCSMRDKHARTTRPCPVVDLPLGASEDRVVGALDLEKALVGGVKAFEPGLLARANRGFLYVDEVNLLEDHIVDLLLDVAASGVNLVEREGLSVRHPSRFVLVGSGNPEEGELRPQLLDRFGLAVDVAAPKDIASRVEVIKRREAYERDPEAFLDSWKGAEQKLRSRIKKARSALAAIETPDEVLELAARLCLQLGIDGMRGELTLIRAARAHAAFSNASGSVTREHILGVAPMALSHRLRRDPLDEAGSAVRVERAVADLSHDGEVAGHA